MTEHNETNKSGSGCSGLVWVANLNKYILTNKHELGCTNLCENFRWVTTWTIAQILLIDDLYKSRRHGTGISARMDCRMKVICEIKWMYYITNQSVISYLWIMGMHERVWTNCYSTVMHTCFRSNLILFI